MARLTNMLLVTVALAAATTGCAKKHPAELPPVAGPAPQDQTGTSIRPGSRADFERSVLSNTIHFALDRYDIDPQSQRILDSQVQWLRQWPNVPISLEGHCDERGTREYNLGLGERRGNAVSSALQAAGGSASQLEVISYGKEKPVCREHNEDCWSKNRRVEIVYTAQ